MDGLTFSGLPMLQQVTTHKSVASVLWSREDVVALWAGSSFARGEADLYSDLDFVLQSEEMILNLVLQPIRLRSSARKWSGVCY